MGRRRCMERRQRPDAPGSSPRSWSTTRLCASRTTRGRRPRTSLRKEARHPPAIGFPLPFDVHLVRLPDFARVDTPGNQRPVPHLRSLRACARPTSRIDTQAQVVALAVQAVGEAPAVRPALDEQEQEQASPSLRRLRGSPGLTALMVWSEAMRLRALQELRMCKNPHCEVLAQVLATTNRKTPESSRTSSDMKKAPTR